MGWKRWLRYGKAKVDAVVRDVDDALDRKEAELAADRDGKPWLADDDTVPSYEETKARIDATAGTPPAPAGDATFDLAEQQREADERLAQIRASLGLDEPPPA